MNYTDYLNGGVAMISVTATEFIKNFGRHAIEAQREPIAVTNHGRVTAYYISAHEYEELQKIRKAMRRSYTLDTLPDHLYEAIVDAKMDPKYNYLDALLEEENRSPGFKS